MHLELLDDREHDFLFIGTVEELKKQFSAQKRIICHGNFQIFSELGGLVPNLTIIILNKI